MTWLLTSPGHQQLWYWLFRINASLFSMEEDFEYLQYLIAKISQKRRYSFVPLKINSARHVLTNAWWRHQMEAFSALLAICAGNSPVPLNSRHKGQWRGALMFSLICARINGWVNNGEAGDLRRHRSHYDVIVMNPIVAFMEQSKMRYIANQQFDNKYFKRLR